MRLRFILSALTLSLGAMGTAQAASPAIATTDVNMRIGPSTYFEVVRTVPGGAPVRVHQCLTGNSWCEVSFGPYEGWISGAYLEHTGLGHQQYNGSQYRPMPVYQPQPQFRRLNEPQPVASTPSFGFSIFGVFSDRNTPQRTTQTVQSTPTRQTRPTSTSAQWSGGSSNEPIVLGVDGSRSTVEETNRDGRRGERSGSGDFSREITRDGSWDGRRTRN